MKMSPLLVLRILRLSLTLLMAVISFVHTASSLIHAEKNGAESLQTFSMNVKFLCGLDIKKLLLWGQNVNAYGIDLKLGESFADLRSRR